MTAVDLGGELQNYREWLRAELLARCKRNPRYSLRAFSKSLGISPAYLSYVFSGKRELTLAAAKRIAANFADPDLGKVFLAKVLESQSSLPASKKRKSAISGPTQKEMLVLKEDSFAVISDWYHYAINELTLVRGFRPEPTWIARKLGIKTSEASLAWGRLIRLGLVQEQSPGIWRKTGAWLTSTQDVPSTALRKFHFQVLQLAMRSIEGAQVTERDLSCITVPVDLARLPAAKEQIKRFRRRMARFLSEGSSSRVYQLAIQLYPVSL